MSQWNAEFKTLTKELKDRGYSLDRVRGSHYIYTDGKHTFSIPKNLNRMIFARLSKEIKAVEV